MHECGTGGRWLARGHRHPPPPLARVVRWPRPHHARRRRRAIEFAKTDTLTADAGVRWPRQVPRSSAGGRTGPLSMGRGGLGQHARYVYWPRHVGGQGSRIVPFASAHFDTSSCLKSSTGHGMATGRPSLAGGAGAEERATLECRLHPAFFRSVLPTVLPHASALIGQAVLNAQQITN